MVFLHISLPFVSPFTFTVLFHYPLHFLVSPLPFFLFSFHLSTHNTSISSLCLALQPSEKKRENRKTANPAASYGIRVYQPIMPFSDLFSSQDRSLCACIPSTPPPHLSLIAQQRRRMLYFQLQNLLRRPPLIVIVVSTLRGVCQKLHRERERETPVNAAPHNH